MEPFYQDSLRSIYLGDSKKILPKLPAESIDLLCTDPPYGISFMGKDWDKALPDKAIWAECLRVLKPGAFAFVMSIPRSDCLSRMIISLEDVGFRVDFTPIYWTYASGFPKAQNIGKAVDKRLGVEREVIGKRTDRAATPKLDIRGGNLIASNRPQIDLSDITAPATPQAKALDGSYGGFQPKPAVEVIIVAMKPLSGKTFVDQALKNRKGITWLDDGRIPLQGIEEHRTEGKSGLGKSVYGEYKNEPLELSDLPRYNNQGRFPANLLVSDDVLNDGRVSKSGQDAIRKKEGMFLEHRLGGKGNQQVFHPDSGSFSRYFDLDKWWAKTFPFLIVPKASKSEKEKLLDMPRVVKTGLPLRDGSGDYVENEGGDGSQSTRQTKAKNIHPTIKPIKLMSYLITLGSREGDTVLDPFLGSGTTALATSLLSRKCVSIEIKRSYCEIAANRCRQMVLEL